MSLDASEFIKRFFRHVLPCGFYKIRYFGIMAQCNMTTKLALCFELLEKAAYYPQLQGLPAIEVLQMVTGIDPFVCPHCKKGRMQAISLWMDKHAEPG
jgi:hypothetical protein